MDGGQQALAHGRLRLVGGQLDAEEARVAGGQRVLAGVAPGDLCLCEED